MERVFVAPRPGYREKIEALGFDFHGDYWREEACYRLSSNEVEMLETATAEAYRMYCDAVEYILNDQPEFMERILQLGDEYDSRMVICALNEAAVYDKRNLNYIENILISWRQKGLSTEDVESGKR